MSQKNPNFLSTLFDPIRIMIWGDVLQPEAVIELLTEELHNKYAVITDSAIEVRAEHLKQILRYLETKGFPSSVTDCAEMSIIPFILQELNSSDINWTSRNANLKQLTALLDIDFLIQNKGKKRLKVTNPEFKEYLENTRRYIDYWKDKITIKSHGITIPEPTGK